jgi:CRISPR-associated endonuclease/helicase Cas3
LAHLLVEAEGGKEHLLADHLAGVAERAGRFAAAFGAGEWGRLAGLWHDLGKYSDRFQEYLARSAAGDEKAALRLRTDHSSAGAQHAVGALGGAAGKALAYAIAGHHAGLADHDVGDRNAACLAKRLEKDVEDWSACPAGLLGASPPAYPFPPPARGPGFHAAFFVRMLFSCLVDADFLDTERFMDPARADERGAYPPLGALKARFDRELGPFLAAKSGTPTPLNARRAAILGHCRRAASAPPGLFSLSVPTGGGKTLSSMAFALDHAVLHGMTRIVHVMPVTAIIEQNARVFRDFLGQDADAVLEHHSSFDPADHDLRGRLATENWDAPVVVTTAVQFFESLFANRAGRCRKLHNLARAVVVLDEAQTLPRDYLEPCLAALRELTAHYGASVVLCTATQPALERTEEFAQGLEGVREIIPDARALALAPEFRRARFVMEPEPLDDAELAERLAACGRGLCVVNTRPHARAVYAALRDRPGGGGDGSGLFHLSGNMCAAHRARVLELVRTRLAEGGRCLVVSTSLIEAGVDISFPVVFRAMAGLDQIIQAAGRCNREGAGAAGVVHVFAPRDRRTPDYLAQPVAATHHVLHALGERFDPLDPATVAEYFRELFWRAGPGLDRKNILPDLERTWLDMKFPFAAVAERFRIIESSLEPVVAPWDGRARELIQALRRAEHPGSVLRRLQPYVVQVSPRLFDRLRDGYVEMVHDQYAVLRTLDGCYSDDVGLDAASLGVVEPSGLIA